MAGILKIDNLWAFTSLRKLQLDNNLIETIENLDSLVHLEWLGQQHMLIQSILYPHDARVQTSPSTK